MTADPFTVPAKDDDAPAFSPATAASLPPDVALPPAPPAPDDKPKRPTTRAGRRAAAAAKNVPGSGKDTKPKTTKPTPRKASLETRLAANLAGLGTVVAISGGMVSPAFVQDGVLITTHSADVAKALAKVADDQPQVKAALETWLTAGVWSGLVSALLPLAVGIAGNHGAIPAHMAAMFAAPVPEAPAGG